MLASGWGFDLATNEAGPDRRVLVFFSSTDGRPTKDAVPSGGYEGKAVVMTTAGSEPEVFAAISHPARRRMLDLLADDGRAVNAIATHFEMSRPAVSQHLRTLLDVGLVTEQRHGRERRYRLVPERLGPVRDWFSHYEWS